MKQKRGFTLVELIIVLAILAIIAAIAVPTAFGSIEKAKDRAAEASMDNVASAFNAAKAVAQLDLTFTGVGGYYNYKNGEFSFPAGFHPDSGDAAILEALNGLGLQTDARTEMIISTFPKTETGKELYLGAISYYPKGKGTKPYYYKDYMTDDPQLVRVD